MAVTATKAANFNNVANHASGKLDTDAAAAAAYTIPLGFKPRVFRIHNLTDRISYEWLDGMTNPGALKTAAAGTRTLETTEGPTVNAAGSGTAVAQVSDPGLLVGGEHTNAQGGLLGNNVTIPATIMLASKSFAWEALA